jgi:hypothetical protein
MGPGTLRVVRDDPLHPSPCARCGDFCDDLLWLVDGRAYCEACCRRAGGLFALTMLLHAERVTGVVHVGSLPRRRPLLITLDRATAPGRFGGRRQFSLFPTQWRPVEELHSFLEAAASSPIRVDDPALAALLRLHGVEAIG